jgi:hypothetical protein
MLRLAPGSRALRGPDKYKVLEHRRHQAQIKARRLLELADEQASGCRRPEALIDGAPVAVSPAKPANSVGLE